MEVEESPVNVQPEVVQPPKVKRGMNPAEKERNERRKKAFKELKRMNPKAKWTDASELVGYRNRGDKASEQEFLRSIAARNNVTKKASPAAPAAPAPTPEAKEVPVPVAPVTAKAWKNLKAQVNQNVAASGMKVNGLNRRALATARRARPNLSVANFMKNRAPHKRRTKKNVVPAVWKNIKAQVNQDVAASGMKVNGLNRRALATARRARPNLSVANFMKNRAPHKRRTKRVVPVNSYNVQKAKNKAMQNYYNQKKAQKEQNLRNFAPQGNAGRLEALLEQS